MSLILIMILLGIISAITAGRRLSRRLTEFTLIALLALPSLASADPVPASRRIDWTYTGVPGGIPNRTNICATFSPGATAAAINAAIAACNNGVVYLNSGTYTAASLGGTIQVYNSNVTLRGAGADSTILQSGTSPIVRIGHGNNVCFAGSLVTTGCSSKGPTVTSGGSKGTNTVTVSSATGLSAGMMIEMDQPNPWTSDPNSYDAGRAIRQVNIITGVNGNMITFRNPFVLDFTSGSFVMYYTPFTWLSGVEALKLDYTTGTYSGVNFPVEICDSCWVKGVESSHARGYVIFLAGTVNSEIRDSYFHDGGAGPDNEGLVGQGSWEWGGNSNNKFENNIINNIYPNIQFYSTNSGNYVGYNYSRGTNSSQFWDFDDGHMPMPLMNLWEGNITSQIGVDGYYGGALYGTFLRNYATGYNYNVSASGDAAAFERFALNYNLVGNVIGSTNQAPAGYKGCGFSPSPVYIYRLGYPNLGNCNTTDQTGQGLTAPTSGYPDGNVAATMLRWGNYDYFHNAAQWNCSEVPSGVTCPGSNQSIPASYIYTSTPAWWTPGIPWPPIGPDVTGGNGDTAGHVNKIPAQVCLEKSNLLGGGSFNASKCYGASLEITSPLKANGSVGIPFKYRITATKNPTSFNAAGLPPGLWVNRTTGVISGTPTAAGSSSVTLRATHATTTGSARLVLKISAATSPAITSSSTVSALTAAA
jgi:hypothetical protein